MEEKNWFPVQVAKLYIFLFLSILLYKALVRESYLQPYISVTQLCNHNESFHHLSPSTMFYFKKLIRTLTRRKSAKLRHSIGQMTCFLPQIKDMNKKEQEGRLLQIFKRLSRHNQIHCLYFWWVVSDGSVLILNNNLFQCINKFLIII